MLVEGGNAGGLGRSFLFEKIYQNEGLEQAERRFILLTSRISSQRFGAFRMLHVDVD